MPDILIRNLSESAIEQIDKRAADLGLSRNEFLKRELERDMRAPIERPTTLEDLRRSAEIFADLADPEVMDGAWR